jgi:hypothetical protein
MPVCFAQFNVEFIQLPSLLRKITAAIYEKGHFEYIIDYFAAGPLSAAQLQVWRPVHHRRPRGGRHADWRPLEPADGPRRAALPGGHVGSLLQLTPTSRQELEKLVRLYFYKRFERGWMAWGGEVHLTLS